MSMHKKGEREGGGLALQSSTSMSDIHGCVVVLQELPEDYICPICGASKDKFESRVKVGRVWGLRHTHICAWVHMCVCVHVHMCVCVQVSVRVCTEEMLCVHVSHGVWAPRWGGATSGPALGVLGAVPWGYS